MYLSSTQDPNINAPRTGGLVHSSKFCFKMQDTAIQPQPAEAEGPPCTGTPQPLRTLFAEAARKNLNGTAVVSLYQQPMPALCWSSKNDNESLVWTFEQLNKAADLQAAAFHARGIRKGMRIAAFLFNSAEWALLFWSSLKLGTVFVPLDARSVSRQEEVQHYLNVAKPAVLVVGDDTAAEILQRNNALDLADSVLKVVASSDRPVKDGWVALQDIFLDSHNLETGVEAIGEARSDFMSDPVLIVFTSGTSGLPKACPHTNMTLWTSYQAASALRPLGPDDSIVQHLPPSHSFACLDMMQCWCDGATIVYPGKSFDAKATLDAIEIMQCTCMSGQWNNRP